MVENNMIFYNLYKKALSLNTDKICRIKKGKCIRQRLGFKPNRICDVCANVCQHFEGTCQIQNILCKAWTCPNLDPYLTDEFKAAQEEVIKEAVKAGYNKYCLTRQEIEEGKECPINSTSNKRIDNLIYTTKN